VPAEPRPLNTSGDLSEHPLTALLRPRWPISVVDGEPADDGAAAARVLCRRGDEPPLWLHGAGVAALAAPFRGREPEGGVFATFRDRAGTVVRAFAHEGEVVVPFSLAEAYHAFVHETWRDADSSSRALAPWQLALFYRVKGLIPRRVQLFARRALIRYQGVPSFPTWPLDTSVSRLLEFCGQRRSRRASSPGSGRGGCTPR
jgi:hypothetical protein